MTLYDPFIRTGSKVEHPEEIKALRASAASFAELVASIKQSKYLRSLDSGEKLDPRDKIRATARRVGFQVPAFSDDPASITGPLGKLGIGVDDSLKR